jgi:hypothetical protein
VPLSLTPSTSTSDRSNGLHAQSPVVRQLDIVNIIH